VIIRRDQNLRRDAHKSIVEMTTRERVKKIFDREIF